MNRFALVVTMLLAGVSMVHAAVGEWADSDNARVRLIASALHPDGRVDAGIEIELAPDWTTYWRSPGDAGIAPVMDFSGSKNIGPVDVAFPVPERHDDGFTVTNVYTDHVILPLSAALTDPKAGGQLSVKLDVGVCKEVCIPEHFEVTLPLDSSPDPDTRDALRAVRESLPKPAEPGTLAVDKIWREGGTDKRPVFQFSAWLLDAKSAEIFVEGPSDWYPDTPKLVGNDGGKPVYAVKFDRLTAKTAIAGAKFRVTIVSGGRAVEQWIGLD